MPDTDRSSKTEEPTPKRLQEAFEEGNFAKAQEIGVAFGLGATFLVLLFALPAAARSVLSMGGSVFAQLHMYDLHAGVISFWAAEGFSFFTSILAPVCLAMVAAALAAGGIQSGFRLSPKALEPKFSRLNPIQGIKRVISKDVLVRFGIDLLKLVAILGVLYTAIDRIVRDPVFHTVVDPEHIAVFMSGTALHVLARVLLAMIIIALISYLYQKHKTQQDLKMTKEEVKQERKNTDVDPHVRGAMRQMARRLLQKQMLADVPTADVVVTNPTHYAVALKYEKGKDEAPMVLAKGENLFALRIKELAATFGVPVVENKPVARMLYRFGKVGEAIPLQLYQAVAEILAYVYRTHKYYFHQLKQRRGGGLVS